MDEKPAARVSDPLEPYGKPNSPKHGRAIGAGSATVFFDVKPATHSGDLVNCGGVLVGGGTETVG
ncbi:MAG: PAAR domain-containing protein [Halodesulfovibrio sp.]|uniref:PAAR domain-containing protein n=1 Tax=Halodesulfovibrio sp. TaxID=1912772 RepID=UPI00359E7A12